MDYGQLFDYIIERSIKSFNIFHSIQADKFKKYSSVITENVLTFSVILNKNNKHSVGDSGWHIINKMAIPKKWGICYEIYY